MKTTRLFLAAAASIVFVSMAHAQSAAERREELARVADMVNDPDPLMRLANMEQIVSEGDPLKVQIAVKTAMASDDKDLRGMAMKAYIAANKHLIFKMLPTPEDQAAIAKLKDEDERHKYYKSKSYMYYLLNSVGFTMDLSFDYSIADPSGQVDWPSRGKAEFRVIGDRIQFKIGTCNFSIRAQPDLVLRGVGRCEENGWPEFPIESEMY